MRLLPWHPLAHKGARLSPNRLPQEHPYHDSTSAKSTIAVAAELFIYNPNKGPAATKARPTLVQNEVAEVFVTLQNPFLFELKIQSIELRYTRRSRRGDIADSLSQHVRRRVRL